MRRRSTGYCPETETYTTVLPDGVVLELSIDDHKRMVEGYVLGDTVSKVAGSGGLTEKELRSYLRVWGVTRDSSPIADHELHTVSESSEAERIRRVQAERRYHASRQSAIERDAARWQNFETSVLERVLKEVSKPSSMPMCVPRSYGTYNQYALVLPLQDIHHGRYTSMLETREHCDINTPGDLAMSAMCDVLDRSRVLGTPEEIVITQSGDFYNSEADGRTTNGTPQDNCGTSGIIATTGLKLSFRMVDVAAQYSPKVRVVVTPGNHAGTTAAMHRVVLQERYSGYDNITVEGDLHSRQYVEYGTSLLCLTHGNGAKPSKLPSVISQEARESWGRTEHTLLFTGHLHHVLTQDLDGVLHFQAPSTAPTDKYHVTEGYTAAQRGVIGVCVDRETGAFAQFIGRPSIP